MQTRITQEELNYSLYLAAEQNNEKNIMHFLSLGAKNVDINQNSSYNHVKSIVGSVSDGQGHSLSVDTTNALGWSLYHKNLNMIALLVMAIRSNNEVVAERYFQTAQFIDNGMFFTASKKFVLALTDPKQVLFAERSEGLFSLYKLKNLQFSGGLEDEHTLDSLNTLIAHTYHRAQELFTSSHFWTIGKTAKALAILSQLSCLHEHYTSQGVLPEVKYYLQHATSGRSLADILKEKRTPNPNVFFADSWTNLTEIDLESNYRSTVSQKY
ncbi:MAG: hypothetical protein ACD_46C00314G0006 [uncultured bacterium]|nr:MAG: hypothetical protein ACD_46C00314G0006 [uncultured bacterium]